MKILRQIGLTALVIVAGLYVWITYVPAAHPLLERLGLFDLLGIEPAQAQVVPENKRRGGGSISVITAVVTEKALADRINAIGDGRALRSVTVRSNAVGVITDLPLTAGAFVESGSVILKLLDEEEQIALEQARIELENARTDAARVERLRGSGAATEVRLSESELALRSAELAVRQAEFALSQREVKAPISGWIGILDLEQGDRVNAQDVLVTITDRSDILIDFRVPDRVVGKMTVGQTFDLAALGLRDLELTGQISAIDSVVDRASRTLLVQGRVSNAEDLLRAGMAFSVNLTFPGPTMLSIAPLAVQWSSEGPFVWAVREGKAVQVPVAIVQRNSEEVLVSSDDLVAGDEVVTEGVQTLREGAEVTVQTQDATAAARAAGATL
jgi:RND family efflux transporter MFP subunit